VEEDDKAQVSLSEEESFWLWVMRWNKTEKKERIDRELEVGRLQIKYTRRRKSEFWGRFGGGWNWKLGFQAGGNSIIFNLLIASLSFYLKPKEKKGD
jgi:hypothetical protein